MNLFVTGASGFVGRAVVQELLAHGHRVVGLVRSDDKAREVEALGAQVASGALEDVDTLARLAAASDGVIHTAYIHDFSKLHLSASVDEQAIAAIGGALAGSNKPFVVTSAIGVLGGGKINTEAEPADPASPGRHRLIAEQATLALAGKGVRASVLRLPPSTHGDGDYAFVATLVKLARDTGVSGYVGDGANRWAAVHRFDAAALYRLAAENGQAGATYHAIQDEGIPTRRIAEVIGAKLGVPVASKPPEHFGWLGKFAAMEMAASSHATRAALGWAPTHVGLLADLEHGSYFTGAR